MHIITVSVTVSLIKTQLSLILKKGSVNRISEKLNKNSQKGNKFVISFEFGPVLGG